MATITYFPAATAGAVAAVVAGTGITVDATDPANPIVTNSLAVGLAGGQTIKGGTASGESLTYSSTTHATKGKHIFGTTLLAFIDENNTNGNVLSIGQASPPSNAVIYAFRSNAAATCILANSNTATTAYMANVLQTGTSSGFNGKYFTMLLTGTSWTTVGVLTAGSGQLEVGGGTGNLVIDVAQASGDIVFATKATLTERLRIATGGEITFPATGKLGTFGATAVAQQTVGANVNNVAASGTTGQFDDFTNGTVYATDYAALHATVYQLTRSVAQLTVTVRNYGLGA